MRCHRNFAWAAAAVAAASLWAGPVSAQDYAHYKGGWHGPFMFAVVVADLGVQGATAIHPGDLRIDADGSVHGAVPDARCTMAGSSSDYVSPANASLDLVFSGCTDGRFNGHFSGRLINNPVMKYGSLRLSSVRPLDTATAQVSAIIQR